MASSAEACAGLLILIFSLSCLTFIPLAFGVGYTTPDLFDQDSFKLCISLSNIGPSQPNDAELTVLKVTAYIGAILVLSTSCCAKSGEQQQQQKRLQSIGCLWLLDSLVGSVLFMHIYTYLAAANSSCSVVDNFTSTYNWSIAGVVVGSMIVSLTCCLFSCGVFAGLSEAGKKQNDDGTGRRNSIYDNFRERLLPNNQQRNQPQLNAAQREYIGGVLSLAVIEDCGFCVATENNRYTILNRLNSTNPSGQTALRDAVVEGITKLLALKVVIARLGAIQHKFIHIVLTDGQDTSSRCSLNDTQSYFLKLGREIGGLCKTYFIGIGLGYQERTELESIANLAGNAADVYNCNDVQLSDIFERIKINIGIQKRIAVVTDGTNYLAAQRNEVYVEAQHQKYLILFTLDKSGSMSGGRWRRVVGAVNGFCQGMGKSDIIGCVLFNDKVQCITGR